MPTPNLVELQGTTGFVGVSYGDFTCNQNLGPFLNGSTIYVSYMRVNPSTFHTWLTVASSMDGVNFSALDHAHAPEICRFVINGPAAAPCQDNTNPVIWISYATAVSFGSATSLALISFDMGTNLYGSVLSGGPSLGTSYNLVLWAMVMLSNGDLAILYSASGGNGGASDLKVVTCTQAGTWGTPVTVVAYTGSRGVLGLSMAADSAGNAWILYYRAGTGGGGGEFHSCKFDGSSISSDTLQHTATSSGTGGVVATSGTGRYIAGTDTVVMPFMADNLGTAILRIDSASTSPAYTVEAVGSYNSNYQSLSFYTDVSATNYFLAYEDYSTTEQAYTWTRAASGGSWTGPSTFWDYDVDPPLPAPSGGSGPSIEQNNPFGLQPIGSGNYGSLISFFGEGDGVPSHQFCNTLYFLGAPATVTELPFMADDTPAHAVLTGSGNYAMY